MRRVIDCWVPIRADRGQRQHEIRHADTAAAVTGGAAMRKHWGPRRPVWMAASTHEGEELAVLEAHLEVLKRLPDALLLMAPRHPERFRWSSIRCAVWVSRWPRAVDACRCRRIRCFVIDAMGELMPFFAASDLAFVGGSLVPIGGHNVLEPAALSKPVLVGPHTFNFEEITLALIRGGGAKRVLQSEALGEEVVGLLHDTEQCTQMGRQARVVFDSERGAVERVMKLIDRMLQE
jgi:3-deoxy-D-manno-octulosonic-acid transferase